MADLGWRVNHVKLDIIAFKNLRFLNLAWRGFCSTATPPRPARSPPPPCTSDIYVYFNVNFNVFFKLIKVHLLVSELYRYISKFTRTGNFVLSWTISSQFMPSQFLGSIYHSPSHTWVYQVTSFLLFSSPKHATFPKQYLVSGKNHEAPRYAVFSLLLLLLYPNWAEIFPLVLSYFHRWRWPSRGLRRGLRPLASWNWEFNSRPTRLSVCRECYVFSGSVNAERQQWGRLGPSGLSSHEKNYSILKQSLYFP